VIERILPPLVASAEVFGDDPAATLFPEEYAVVVRATERRRREFATARACVHAALARLGQPPVPVLTGPGGAPQWPDGVVGSITHCAGYRAAAVGLTSDIVSLGVDAEPNEPLPEGGMLKVIANDSERAYLGDLAVRIPGICWDRLLFCAKEAVYKTWFPLTRRWLDFRSATVVINPEPGTFAARLLVEGPRVGGSELSLLRGRWISDRGLLVTAIVVPVPGRPAGAAHGNK
jgi:4'-phosphopantetheinyl transferase EntD